MNNFNEKNESDEEFPCEYCGSWPCRCVEINNDVDEELLRQLDK